MRIISSPSSRALHKSSELYPSILEATSAIAWLRSTDVSFPARVSVDLISEALLLFDWKVPALCMIPIFPSAYHPNFPNCPFDYSARPFKSLCWLEVPHRDESHLSQQRNEQHWSYGLLLFWRLSTFLFSRVRCRTGSWRSREDWSRCLKLYCSIWWEPIRCSRWLRFPQSQSRVFSAKADTSAADNLLLQNLSVPSLLGDLHWCRCMSTQKHLQSSRFKATSLSKCYRAENWWPCWMRRKLRWVQ